MGQRGPTGHATDFGPGDVHTDLGANGDQRRPMGHATDFGPGANGGETTDSGPSNPHSGPGKDMQDPKLYQPFRETNIWRTCVRQTILNNCSV